MAFWSGEVTLPESTPNPSLAHLIMEDCHTISHAVSGTNPPFPSSLKDSKTTQNQTRFPGTMYQTNGSATRGLKLQKMLHQGAGPYQGSAWPNRHDCRPGCSRVETSPCHNSWHIGHDIYCDGWMDLILMSISILNHLSSSRKPVPLMTYALSLSHIYLAPHLLAKHMQFYYITLLLINPNMSREDNQTCNEIE